MGCLFVWSDRNYLSFVNWFDCTCRYNAWLYLAVCVHFYLYIYLYMFGVFCFFPSLRLSKDFLRYGTLCELILTCILSGGLVEAFKS